MPGPAHCPPPSNDSDRRLLDHPVLGPLPPVAEVAFTFDRLTFLARDGEPIAGALLAAGVRVLRTMPGSGEPRGSYCLVGRSTDCLVVVDGCTNVPACLTAVRAGMRVVTEHGPGGDAWEPPHPPSVPPPTATGNGR